ncbi:hypothetical protein V1477_018453 [Vespula maculifrons]|uniref:Uncharacterized protein n=1 Tax=Vespula maculifrons TaxID=7453 RepID=A0ABD2AVE7_VESMC
MNFTTKICNGVIYRNKVSLHIYFAYLKNFDKLPRKNREELTKKDEQPFNNIQYNVIIKTYSLKYINNSDDGDWLCNLMVRFDYISHSRDIFYPFL